MTRDHIGVLAAVTSSAIGGVAGGATRFVIHATDPVTLGVLRFGTGFLILLAIALILKSRWPKARDLIAVALLGILFFFAFSVLFNLAYSYTTAARGALTLSTMPLTTMLVGAALGIERISPRKTLGVLIAIAGVFLALILGLSAAPAGAWRGELVMLAATFCMSLYNVWSRPFIARSDPLVFLTAGMGAAAACLLVWRLPSTALTRSRSSTHRNGSRSAISAWSAVPARSFSGCSPLGAPARPRQRLRSRSIRYLPPSSTRSRSARRSGLI